MLEKLRMAVEKISWRYRYARYISQHTASGWSFAWHLAGQHIEDALGDWRGTDPEAAAYGEISSWDAD